MVLEIDISYSWARSDFILSFLLAQVPSWTSDEDFVAALKKAGLL